MNNTKKKTCGECIFYHGIRDDAGICALTDKFEQTCDFVYCCKSFHPAPPITKGDKIKQMSNSKLAEISVYEHKHYSKEGREYIWFSSIFAKHINCAEREDAVTIALMKLNAPAESEVEDE